MVKLQEANKNSAAVLLSSRLQACKHAQKLAEDPTALGDDTLEAAVESMASLDINLPPKVLCNLAERRATRLVQEIAAAANEDEVQEKAAVLGRHLSCIKPTEEEDAIRPSYLKIVQSIQQEADASAAMTMDLDEQEEATRATNQALEVGLDRKVGLAGIECRRTSKKRRSSITQKL